MQRRGGVVRAGRWGAGGVVTSLVVALLWSWSSGAADPLAPGIAPMEVAVPPRGASSGEAPPGPDAASVDALDLVRSAAAATAAAPTASFTLTVALVDDDEQPREPRTEVAGAVDARTGDVAVTLRSWEPVGGAAPTTVEAIGIGEALYVHSPSLDPPDGPPTWWRTDVGSGPPDAPAAVAELVSLVGSGEVAEVLGASIDDGVPVTRVRVALAGTGTASALGGEASGWAVVGVTDAGTLRSIEVRATGAWGAAAGRGVVVRLVLDGLGDPVAIVAPDPAAVREAGRPPAAAQD